MYATNGRMLAHGTTAFDSDIDEAINALKVKRGKIESKRIKSIRPRATNIKPFLPEEERKMTTEESRQEVLLKIFGAESVEEVETCELTDED